MTDAAEGRAARADRISNRRAREARNLFARLPAAYAASRRQAQQLLRRGGGLSVVEWRTLWDLAECGPMTVRDLAEIQRTDHSLISRALPRMRDKGLVAMRRDTGDGRQMIVALTAPGRAAYARAAPIMRRRRDALREVFTEAEIAAFVGFLDRMEQFLQQPVTEILGEEPTR